MPPPFISLAPSAARVATGNTDLVDLTQIIGPSRAVMPPQLLVQSDVTAVSGTATPTVTVTLEDSIDGVTWNTVGTFAAQTAVGRLVIAIGLRGDAYPAGFRWPVNVCKMRVKWTISGTNPSLTFSVKAVVL